MDFSRITFLFCHGLYQKFDHRFFVYVVLLCLGIEHATSTPQQDLYRMNRVEKVPKHATVTQHWPHFMLECAIFSRKKFFRKLIHYNQALAMHHQPKYYRISKEENVNLSYV